MNPELKNNPSSFNVVMLLILFFIILNLIIENNKLNEFIYYSTFSISLVILGYIILMVLKKYYLKLKNRFLKKEQQLHKEILVNDNELK